MTIIRPDIGLIYSLLTAIAKFIDLSLLIDYSTYFKDVIQYCRLSIQYGVRLIKYSFLTIEISQIQFILVSSSAE